MALKEHYIELAGRLEQYARSLHPRSGVQLPDRAAPLYISEADRVQALDLLEAAQFIRDTVAAVP